MEYYDVSQEVLAVYLQNFPGSPVALNLKACNTFRLYSGAAAEKDLKPLLNIMVSKISPNIFTFNIPQFFKFNVYRPKKKNPSTVDSQMLMI